MASSISIKRSLLSMFIARAVTTMVGAERRRHLEEVLVVREERL